MTLPRSKGLCGNALEVLEMLAQQEDEPRRKSWSQSPLVINDITQDDEFKNRPFVTKYPSLRFYAAMPISTKSGFIIGALTVMDDRPREGLTGSETEFMGDSVRAIMAHLETTRSNEGHRRSEKMVKGLGVFMEGGTDLGDWWLELGNIRSRRQHGLKDVAGPKSKSNGYGPSPTLLRERPIPPARTMEAEVPVPSTLPDGQSRISIAVPSKKADCTDKELLVPTEQGGNDGHPAAPMSGDQESPSQQPLKTADSAPVAIRGQTVGRLTLDLQDRLVSQSVKDMFSRASNIIQECIEVDGAIFLGANVYTRKGYSR